MRATLNDYLDQLRLENAGMYLHSKEQNGEFTDESDSIACKFGSLSFIVEGDEPAFSYPCGYKMWVQRALSDAPQWVRDELKRRHGI